MFFTALDERARIKGSVDPLGLMSVWSGFGRQVVSNLTTVSGSVRGFSVLLIGRYLAQDLIERGRATEDDALPIFLRFEQIAAYVREHAHQAGGDVRGIERVRKYTRELNGEIPIGDPTKGEILGDQKTYGLWGLFSVPARESGLLPPGPVGLEEVARAFVESEYLPRLRTAGERLNRLLLRPGEKLRLKRNDSVYTAVATALPEKLRKAEREFYSQAIRDAQLGQGNQAVRDRQAQCSRLMVECDVLGEGIDREIVTRLAEAAGGHNLPGLALRLKKILVLESLIAPADRVFAHLCARSGHSLEDISKELAERWGTGSMPFLDRETWPFIGDEFRDRMGPEVSEQAKRTLDAFLVDDWRSAADALLSWNELVMRGRRGFPWISVVNGELDVRYRDDEVTLPTRDKLPDVWRDSYFLDSLRAVSAQLEAA